MYKEFIESESSERSMGRSRLVQVLLASEVWSQCFVHGLTTEVEEVMGLLIGWTKEAPDDTAMCYVTHCVQLKRLDKRKDRVEISTEQLCSVFPVLETLNAEKDPSSIHPNRHQSGEGPLHSAVADGSREELRVVGWYHSHPHITVFPSQVDVRTQYQYQGQDPLWIGLIFGVFNQSNSGLGEMPYIAFRSCTSSDLVDPEFCGQPDRSGLQYELIPVSIVPKAAPMHPPDVPCPLGADTARGLIKLPELLIDEVQEVFQQTTLGQCRGDTLTRFHNATVFAQSTTNILSRLCQPLLLALEQRALRAEEAQEFKLGELQQPSSQVDWEREMLEEELRDVKD